MSVKPNTNMQTYLQLHTHSLWTHELMCCLLLVLPTTLLHIISIKNQGGGLEGGGIFYKGFHKRIEIVSVGNRPSADTFLGLDVPLVLHFPFRFLRPFRRLEGEKNQLE